MRKTVKAALAALLVAAVAPANAAIIVTFGGGQTVAANYAGSVVNAFTSTAGITGSGFGVQSGSVPGVGEALTLPAPSSYLYVTAGGSATVSFAAATSFAFDLGSGDNYNGLTINGQSFVFSGFTSQPTGNNDNGLVTVSGTAGETFSAVTFLSSQNSMEVDNLATIPAVPEPATWAMLICGFGLVGAAMRRRNTTSVVFA